MPVTRNLRWTLHPDHNPSGAECSAQRRLHGRLADRWSATDLALPGSCGAGGGPSTQPGSFYSGTSSGAAGGYTDFIAGDNSGGTSAGASSVLDLRLHRRVDGSLHVRLHRRVGG